MKAILVCLTILCAGCVEITQPPPPQPDCWVVNGDTLTYFPVCPVAAH